MSRTRTPDTEPAARTDAGDESRSVPAPERPLREASRFFLVGLGVIALVALALRVFDVLVANRHFVLGGDAVYYHLQGWAIADGHGFVDPGAYYFTKGRLVLPSAYHPPLYGIFLGVVSRLGFWSVRAHRLASGVLGTGTVVVIGLAGRKMLSERTGLIAAAIAAVYANLWINDGALLSESMAALTAALVLLAVYAFWRRPTLPNAAWLGLAFGLAIQARSELLVAAPLMAIPVLWGLRALTVRRRVQMLTISAAGALLLVVPWVGYNLSRFEKPVYLTSGVGAVLSTASCHATYYGDMIGLYRPCYPYPDVPITTDESVRDAIVRKQATTYIKHHLGRYPLVAAVRVGRLWDVFKPHQNYVLNSAIEQRKPGPSQIAFGQYVFLMPLAIAGVIVLRRRRVPISPLLALVVAVSFAAANTFGIVRYRVGAEPVIVLAAAVSIEVLWMSFAGRARPAPG